MPVAQGSDAPLAGKRAAQTYQRPPTSDLTDAVGVPVGEQLLIRALTHRSYAYEHGGLPTNERLEFLGDSVLGVVVTTRLYRDYPDLPEGQLAKLRASVVNMRALAAVARRLGPGGLGAHVYLGKGEEATGGRDKSSILADTLEAVIGAVYEQYGMPTAFEVVERLFGQVISDAAERGAGLDWKTSLQELTADSSLGVPEYKVTATGPDHDKTFTAVAVVSGEDVGSGTGHSKKEAEQEAAEAAWRLLRSRQPDAASVPAIADGSATTS
ncbi:ribonuclease III [Fodinicola acaciae]|uniref:ribonuclease III n=1 Tax=Fodinicola acaciae TaxID=2681555 RepID=UPI0013D57353|nr:ribonuclease III [Fodinicola acaciae]